jgi:predicted AlkP superfamily pyrophosphatase or phosphodiesterase
MKHLRAFIILLIMGVAYCTSAKDGVERPKLVVGLVIDQMRWDYLYRYYDLYSSTGFKRLLKDGFSCENTMINYVPTFTAPGHSCIYTGSVPSIHGIAGNNWIDNVTGKGVYCTDDKTVHMVGTTDPAAPPMSPRNLLTSTITDELRLATNLESRVYGVAIKDRSSILPAGHMANAAYWIDDSTGSFNSSSYYSNPNPTWLQAFNNRHLADSLIKLNWELLLPAASYSQSLEDASRYERSFKGEKAPVFPHKIESLTGKSRYNAFKAMPAGNTITFDLARACMEGEQLGAGKNTDFLCISLSSTDYAGHQFGPNSVELEDMYLRLDREIGDYLNYLDKTVGKGKYLLFITADHGAAHNPQFLIDEELPAGVMNNGITAELKQYLKAKTGRDSIVKGFENYQFYIDEQFISKAGLDREQIKRYMVEFLKGKKEIAYVVDVEHLSDALLPEPLKTMVVNGYNRNRSGVIQVVLNPAWYENSGPVLGTTHGTWNPYDSHIPLLWYGWHVQRGASNKVCHMTDIAATLAAMLHVQQPNGCIGEPIEALMVK